jgi:tripartite ATP-independent transporter DctP family solute receptor
MHAATRGFSLALMLITLLGLTPLPARAAEQVFKLGHMFARNSIPDRAAQKFAEIVTTNSKGALKVEVYAEGLLGDERENLAQLRKGILHFAVTGDVVVSNIGDKYRVVNMPFIYRDARHALKTYDSELGNTIRANMRAEGVEALSWHYVGTRVLTANKPIRNLGDIKGLNLRLPQDSAWITTWRALGANTKYVQFTELAEALKLGSIDAQENPPNFIRASRLHEHQKYLITTHHMPQRQMILASAESWAKLHEDKRALLGAAAREASAWASALAEKEHVSDLNWLTHEGGMSLVEFDHKGIDTAIAGVPEALAGKEGQKILEQIRSIH